MWVAGARPDFMKTAPVVREVMRRGTFDHILVHTGQHYDRELWSIFVDELEPTRFGTNTVLGQDPARIAQVPELIAAFDGRPTSTPPLWDGQAAARMIDVLESTTPTSARPSRESRALLATSPPTEGGRS